jgi:hypothetical protein
MQKCALPAAVECSAPMIVGNFFNPLIVLNQTFRLVR